MKDPAPTANYFQSAGVLANLIHKINSSKDQIKKKFKQKI